MSETRRQRRERENVLATARAGIDAVLAALPAAKRKRAARRRPAPLA